MMLMRVLSLIISAMLTASTAGAAAETEVLLIGDRLTIQAHRTPLRTVLERLSAFGVRVQIDPEIDVLVSGSCRLAPADQALDALLEPFAYVAIWEVVPGPISNLPRLAEVQVFQPGARDRVRPIETESRLRLSRGPLPDSPWFVADEILVRVKPGVNADSFRAWLRSIGATVVASLPSLGVYQLRLKPGLNVLDLVEQLKRSPILNAVEPNYAERLPRGDLQQALASGAALLATPGAPRANAPPVAILDSGLINGFGIDGLVVSRYNAVFPDRSAEDPLGHGTQMALIAAGAVRPRGAAPSSEGLPLIAIRAFDDNGVTSNFAIMRAIDHAVQQGARVINLSWGTQTHSPFLADAIAYAQAKGLVVVAAAGNEPTGAPVYPAAYPGVIAVSALSQNGTPWERSNRGDFVMLAAPGTASFPVGYDGPAGTYAGTSIASAYVARELGLYFARNPKARAEDAKRALINAVSDAGASGRDPIYGHGILDAAAQSRLRKN
jgi:hypothetical protein